MSDKQPDEYEGLVPAAPSAGAPAFGDVAPASASGGRTAPPPPPPQNAEALPAEVDSLPDFQKQPDQDETRPSDGPVTLPGELPDGCLPVQRPGCSNADCAIPTEHPAEIAWQQLVSAVPVEDQLYRLRPRVEGMSYPTEEDFRSAVAAVRPEHADEHSIARLRTAWTDEVAGKLADWSERIRSGLTELSEGWTGTDFEAFEGVCTETRELVDAIIEDVDATVAQLQSTEESIYTLQGGDSGEIPYPAPQFWIDGEWHSWVSVHIRPAWWHGDCIQYTCQDAEHVMSLAGADPEVATEIIDFIDEKVEHYIDYYESPVNIERDGLDPKGITLEEAKELAVADAVETYGGVVEQNWTDYGARHATVDEDINQRSADNDSEQQSMRTVASDKDYPAVADSKYMNLEPPSMEQPTGRSEPEATQDPSLEPPVGGEAPPPAPPGEDDGETKGGLASGGASGGGGLGGGSFGGAGAGAPGATATTGGASPGGAAVGAAAAGGMAAGAATAAGASRGAMGGMMGGMGGGGMAMNDQEREADVDLVEDENMWGFVNEDEDPYA
ncbi:hypothetical protein [Glycomyces tenuis]|uniref:hypothetical protein n=2 Tax=Glycomyces tenuis TaxID=58116 RepID=UPI00041786D4|nr:hypothetical protein [Glycomyces tenuis]